MVQWVWIGVEMWERGAAFGSAAKLKQVATRALPTEDYSVGGANTNLIVGLV